MSRTRALAAIAGVGISRVYRHDEVALGVLAVEAIRAAVADAGLETKDIDGLSTTPYQPFEGAGDTEGVSILTPEFVTRSLGMDVAWAERQLRPLGASLVNTVHAVASGQCRYALCFRGLYSPAGRRYGYTSPETVGGDGQFSAPYGANPISTFALLAQEHMHRYGSTREQLGQFVVRNRDQALKWEHGYWYQRGAGPITLDDYLTARMVCSPLGLHDCDLPIQVAGAFVITTPERAKDLPHRPAYVLGCSSPFTVSKFHARAAAGGVCSLAEYMEHGRQIARHLWKNAGVSPTEVDVANLFDGFSVQTPLWAEAMGFCPEGQGFDFVSSPPIPLNTSSGNLGGGRNHGIGHVMDTVLQIRGEAGPRQVEAADLFLVTCNQNTDGQALLFSRTPS